MCKFIVGGIVWEADIWKLRESPSNLILQM